MMCSLLQPRLEAEYYSNWFLFDKWIVRLFLVSWMVTEEQ